MLGRVQTIQPPPRTRCHRRQPLLDRERLPVVGKTQKNGFGHQDQPDFAGVVERCSNYGDLTRRVDVYQPICVIGVGQLASCSFDPITT